MELTNLTHAVYCASSLVHCSESYQNFRRTHLSPQVNRLELKGCITYRGIELRDPKSTPATLVYSVPIRDYMREPVHNNIVDASSGRWDSRRWEETQIRSYIDWTMTTLLMASSGWQDSGHRKKYKSNHTPFGWSSSREITLQATGASHIKDHPTHDYSILFFRSINHSHLLHSKCSTFEIPTGIHLQTNTTSFSTFGNFSSSHFNNNHDVFSRRQRLRLHLSYC